jgi:multiple sugar transport system permease protein/raffinose/stachyose/melibiose transport system permease protein
MAFPFVWMLLTSLRDQNTIFNGPTIPRHFTAKAYSSVWTSIEFPLHFWNSLWITSVTVIGVLVFATLSGYAFAKLDFPFRNTLFVLLLTTLMMPSTALIIPLYLELKSLGLLDSQAGLVILYISGSAPFSMFLMRAFFQTLPDELIEAARVDGGSELTIFRRVILPLTRPGIATVVIFQFLQTWNEFLIANTVLRNTDSLPLQPVLFTLMGQYSSNWPALTAGLTLSVVPVILVYVRMQRQFVAGMMLGAVKN